MKLLSNLWQAYWGESESETPINIYKEESITMSNAPINPLDISKLLFFIATNDVMSISNRDLDYVRPFDWDIKRLIFSDIEIKMIGWTGYGLCSIPKSDFEITNIKPCVQPDLFDECNGLPVGDPVKIVSRIQLTEEDYVKLRDAVIEKYNSIQTKTNQQALDSFFGG